MQYFSSPLLRTQRCSCEEHGLIIYDYDLKKLERRRTLERIARGGADAEAGVKFSRKPTLTPHQQKEARRRLEAGPDATRSRAQLQRQSEHDFKAAV